MNRIDLLVKIMESFLYSMFQVLSCMTKIRCVGNKDELEMIIMINYTFMYKGEIYQDCINYTVYESDLECEFPYVVNMGLYTIGNKVIDEMTRVFVEEQQERGVI